jgi:hypothetical protein
MVAGAVFHDQRAREGLGYKISIFKRINTYKYAAISDFSIMGRVAREYVEAKRSRQ